MKGLRRPFAAENPRGNEEGRGARRSMGLQKILLNWRNKGSVVAVASLVRTGFAQERSRREGISAHFG